MKRSAHRLVIAGGGTGGHLYPGIAIAEAWLERVDDGQVIFVGSATGLEARVLPPLGHRLECVPTRRLKNATVRERLKTVAWLPGAIIKGAQLLGRLSPDVVLGVGGYASGPVLAAAAITGRCCAVAEQNARPGLTNRVLGRWVRRIYTAFPEASTMLPRGKIAELGNPVRREIAASARHTESDASQGSDPKPRPHRLLILGGSQGARRLNELLPPVCGRLMQRFGDLEVHHQTGRGNGDSVRAAYRQVGLSRARVDEFIDDMANAYAETDLVVARAGATTVAEISCVGRPAVFVPFPFAADDHQAINAQSLVQVGAAQMEREETLTEARLLEVLGGLLADPRRLAEMGRQARQRSRPNAAASIVEDLLTLSSEGMK